LGGGGAQVKKTGRLRFFTVKNDARAVIAGTCVGLEVKCGGRGKFVMRKKEGNYIRGKVSAERARGR